MAATTSHILVIDDDAEIRYSLQRVLSQSGYDVLEAASGAEGIKVAEKHQPPVVFLDNRMDGMSGLETLQHLRPVCPQAMVILMTAFGTAQTAIEAMKFGAFDYIIKPFDVKKVRELTSRALVAHEDLAKAQAQPSAPALNSDDHKEGLVGSSEAMQEVFKVIGQVAASEVTVMITGESGTGKEVVARSVWQHSLRSAHPFLAVNCAAIPDNLIESELFGHEKGSFTGATQQRVGKFEQADGGTLFLDEIGDMALPTQTKILRALQEGEIQRVGGSGTIKVNVRLLAATNKDLEAMVKEGDFREDLYYRLNVMRISIPALRERRGDIPDLVDFILQRMRRARKTRVERISEEALARLVAHTWPGNVRELENVIQRSAVVAQGETILAKDLPREFAKVTVSPSEAPTPDETLIGHTAPPFPMPETDAGTEATPPSLPAASTQPLPAATSPLDLTGASDQLYAAVRAETDQAILQVIEREMIIRVLAETKGNQVKASALLGITRATLRKRIEQFGLKD